jgi:anti-anti-sigma regulatory factor
MSAIIDITTILSSDLKSRSAVSDLSLFIRNMNEKSVVIDFANVKFVTRSFIDEFYNAFLKNKSSETKVGIANVSEDIQMVFDAVSWMQNKEKTVAGDNSSVVMFGNFAEMRSYLRSLPI